MDFLWEVISKGAMTYKLLKRCIGSIHTAHVPFHDSSSPRLPPFKKKYTWLWEIIYMTNNEQTLTNLYPLHVIRIKKISILTNLILGF